MGLHSVVYRNTAVAISASLASMNILAGYNDNVANNQWLPNFTPQLEMAAFFGANMSAARMQTAYLNNTAALWFRPWNQVAAPATNFNIADFTTSPVKLRKSENIVVQTSNSNGAATDSQYGILHFTDGIHERPTGKSLRIRLTGTTTVTANAWTRCVLTPDEVLPNARFAIMGFDAISTTGLAARLNIPGWTASGVVMSPGAVCLRSLADRQPYPWYESPFGKIGEFDNQTIPGLEILCTAADTAQTVFMDIIQL